MTSSQMEPRKDRQSPQRLSEILMAIALATDLGTGQPLGHALRTCYLGMALARAMGCTPEEIRTVHQVALLRFLGCTADSGEIAAMAGGDERAFLAGMAPAVMGTEREGMRQFVRSVGSGHSAWSRARLVARGLADPGGPARTMTAHCEVASMLAQRLGLGDTVVNALAHGYERWDGKGYPEGLRGDAVPLAVRIAIVARDADVFIRLGEDPAVRLQERAGHAYDPQVVAAFLDAGPAAIEDFSQADDWAAVLDAEPQPVATLPDQSLDDRLAVFADFVDLKSSWTRGHSPAVAEVAEAAAATAGLDLDDRRMIRRAGLLHDLGRVGIENGIWDKLGSLTAGEWERVRLHPYYTQRILERCSALAPLGELAACHHERLDRSGYHRGYGADQLPMPARLLAAADVFAAATADRPHRPAMTRDEAASLLEDEAQSGRLDGDAVAAVLDSAGMKVTRAPRDWPAGLTDREVEVLQLIARGRTNREAAKLLHISPKTVGRHVENIYGKIGVSTRPGATIFAMEHRLLD